VTRRGAILIVLGVVATALLAAPAISAQPAGSGEDAMSVAAAGGTARAWMYLVDTSGSMNDSDGSGRIKIEGAKRAVISSLNLLDADEVVGLMTYPAAGSECDVGAPAVALQSKRVAEGQVGGTASISAKVRTLTASGGTPTAQALRAAAAQLAEHSYPQATIVLVSDGESNCAEPEEACAAATELRDDTLNVQVLSFALDLDDDSDARRELECISKATDGHVIDVDDVDQLEELLANYALADLDLRLVHPKETVAEAGAVPVTIQIRTGDGRPAEVVRARIRFDAETSLPVAGPTHRFGNLTAGSTVEHTWQLAPGVALAGRTVRFHVDVSAANLPGATISVAGELRVLAGDRREHAGPLLRDAHTVAILGDSFSSGEGAGGYTAASSFSGNGCHRSPRTYLLPMLNLDAAYNLACSGAVTMDVRAPNAQKGVPAQVDQLRSLQADRGPVDAVVLTLGGNDVGFADIARACLYGVRLDANISTTPTGLVNATLLVRPTGCHETVWGTDTEAFVAARLGPDDGHTAGPFVRNLVKAYLEIDHAVNSRTQVEARGGRNAPIIVLAYPRLLPDVVRPSCGLQSAISTDEVAFVSELVGRINRQVEGAVAAARQLGIPTYFVHQTEDAFLPDHTVCDDDPYVRALHTIRLGLSREQWTQVLESRLRGRLEFAIDVLSLADFSNRTQELLHPNEAGYKALTHAIVRWSNSASGREAADPPRTYVYDPVVTTWSVSDVTLGQLTPEAQPTVQGGTLVGLQASGFAPGSSVNVTVESDPVTVALLTADDEGAIDTRIAVPDELESGTHTVVLRGIDPDARPYQLDLPIRVRPGPPILGYVGASGLLFGGVGALMRGLGRGSQRSRRKLQAT
jgi:Mg-chelatase subunit ChlD/lysophospholipase L1-like esterase